MHRLLPTHCRLTKASTIATVLCAAALAGACSKPPAPQEPIRAVKLMTVSQQVLTARHEYAGEVRARTESRLGFRVAGKLLTRTAEVGQAVRAGQVLAQLDPQDYQLAAVSAGAQVAAARTSRDLAAADLARYRSLHAQNFISQAELQRRESALTAAQSQLEAVQAQASTQSNQTGYTRLQSDVAGVVTAVLAEPGQVLAAGAPVVQLAHGGPRDVVFAVPEDRLAGVPLGAMLRVRPWASAQVFEARVREVAASADPVTRTFSVRLALPPGADLALGRTVTVVAQPGSGAPAAIKLPTSALRQEGAGTAVWVLDEASMTVRSQPIEVLTADANEVVVGRGLSPGMQVVTAGVHVLTPGQRVSIYKQKVLEAHMDKGTIVTNSEASTADAASVKTPVHPASQP